MTKPQRLGLTDINARHTHRQHTADPFKHTQLILLLELYLELIGLIEMIFYRTFIAPGDKDKLGNTACDGLFHGVLDPRLINERQHVLRGGLSRWQKTGAKTWHGKYSFFNR